MDVQKQGLLPEELLLGIPDIDVQHEGIFYRLENLKAASLETNMLPEELAADLLAFLGEHFATEERIALASGIEFAGHQGKHTASLKSLHQWTERVRSGRSDIFTLLRYLEIWFERHILQEDLPFARQLHALSSRDD